MRKAVKLLSLIFVILLCAVALSMLGAGDVTKNDSEVGELETAVEVNDSGGDSSSTYTFLVRDPHHIDGTAYAFVSAAPQGTEIKETSEGKKAAGGVDVVLLSLVMVSILTLCLIQLKVKKTKFNRTQGLLLATLMMFGALAAMPIQMSGSGSIIYVDQDAVGLNDGTSWVDAFNDLQDALGAAAADDEIWVAEGTYKPTTGTDRTATFQLVSDVRLNGGFNGTETSRNQRDWEIYETILSGDIGAVDDSSDNSYTVVRGANFAILDGFIVTRGNADGNAPYNRGGGMYNSGEPLVYKCTFTGNSSSDSGGGMYNGAYSSPMVAGCTFTGNSSSDGGGGMFNDGASSIPRVIFCTFTDNIANEGGGMYNYDCSPFLNLCTFTDNIANEGGGMYNYDSAPTVRACTFTGNSGGIGGGMYNMFYYYDPNNPMPNPMVSDCTFTGNSSGRGGGMYNEICSPTVTNCEFIENSAFFYGGGMNNRDSSPWVINCTFNGNTAEISGGGMVNGSYSNSTVINSTFSDNFAINGGGILVDRSNLTVTNSILWGDIGSEIYSVSGTPVVTYTCIEGGYTGTGNIDVDPLFVNPFVGDYHLQSNSPCIDWGDNASLPADITDIDYDGDTSEPTPLDLDRNDRVVDGDFDGTASVDMGAFEYSPPNNPPYLTYIANVPTDGAGTLLMNAGTTLTITVTGIDPDSDPITLYAFFDAQPLPGGASWTFPQGPSTPNVGIFEWTPTSVQVGVWGPGGSAGPPLTFGVDDGPLFDTEDVTISIGPSTNVAPTLEFYEANTLNPISSITVLEEDTITFDLVSSDPNPPDEIIISYSSANPLPTGATLVKTSGGYPNPVKYVCTWTPSLGTGGQHDIDFIASDNGVPFIETSRMFTIFVTSLNNPPIADANGPYSGDEGSTITFDASGSTDPDGDVLEYRWDFDNDGIWDTTWSSNPYADFTYGDDYGDVTVLEVSDGTLTDTATANVSITNLDPTVTVEDLIFDVEIGLRVAGRKYNNVGMTLYEDGSLLGSLSIERTPGSPDDQMVWMPITFDFAKTYNATVTFTPLDPPEVGANPVWIYIKFEDGSVAEAHHTFNIQQSMKRDSEHPNHVEPWEVDIKSILMGHAIPLTSTAIDQGSDDLGFKWSFKTNTIWLNNDGSIGTSPTDPYPSLGGIFPFSATDTAYLTYSGPETIALIVTDDDGGIVSTTLVIG